MMIYDAGTNSILYQIFTINADNASPNNTQTTALDLLANSFDEVNRVRCFHHTLQLSAHTLIRPFNTGMTTKKADNNEDSDEVEMDEMPPSEDMFDGDDEDEERQCEEGEDVDDPQDEVDELSTLTEAEEEAVLKDTAVV